jgi:DEAD/DEAH box helicase domain-containing protein
MESFIDYLKKMEGYKGQLEHVELLPAKKEGFGSLEKPLTPELQDYLDRKGIRLYRHQADLINEARKGNNAVISTPTASGKTLAFNIPVFEALSKDPEARALYIYPMKALTNDQLKVLLEMEKETGVDIKPRIYDGDTPRRARPLIRSLSRIVLTNPYGLHLYLPWHYQWESFYKNLKFVIIDESHTYRGVFGSNVAMLIRRLSRICQRYGSNPQFILSSATIANPEEHSRKLTGKEFVVVSEDSSETGRKLVRRSTHQESKDLFKQCIQNNLQTLCFTVSRKMAELIARWAREELYESSPKLASAITPYRAGYLPEERREIEKDLRSGSLMGVISTNALELGIDIGSLDCVIISGYPGTIISTWQQAGRAGRTTEDSLVFFVAFSNPLDQYFMNHPHDFFGRTPEHAIIDLENPYITLGHLMCASAELPLTKADRNRFPKIFQKSIIPLKEQNIIRETPLGWVYAGRKRPTAMVELNNISDRTVKVLHNGKVLETMDITKAYNEAHQGAILLHQGETYIIEELNLPELTATVHKVDINYYTEPLKQVDITITNVLDEKKEGIQAGIGEVQVTEHYLKYRVKSYDEILDIRPLRLPPLEFPSVGMWFTIPPQMEEKIEKENLELAGGIHAMEHAMIAMAPLFAMCDRWDLGGVSTLYHPDTEKPTIFIYDSYQGGIGISEKLYQLLKELIQTTLKLVKDCKCSEGCPSCIYSAKCGNENQPLNKKAATYILENLLTII